MPQVSKRFLKREINQKIDRLFWDSIVACNSSEKAMSFLTDLLTPTEVTMLSKRLAIYFLLLKEYEYRDIRELVKVSTTTIGKVSLQLKSGASGMKAITTTLHNQRKFKESLQDIVDAITIIITSRKQGNLKLEKAIHQQRRRERETPL